MLRDEARRSESLPLPSNLNCPMEVVSVFSMGSPVSRDPANQTTLGADGNGETQRRGSSLSRGDRSLLIDPCIHGARDIH